MNNKNIKDNPTKHHTIITDILILLLFFLASFLILVEHWAFTTWSNLSMEEIVYELTNPIEGTAGEIMNGFYFQVLIPAFIITAAAGIIFFLLLPLKRRFLVIIPVCVIAGAIFAGWKTLDIGTWLINKNIDSTYIEDNYADPADVKITFPEKKRNLIYIYLESMEMTYSDETHGGAFEDDYIPELTQLAEENEDFSGDSNILNGGISTSGTGWTMGAMFAQTSGLPLKVDVDTNSYYFDHFFPNMTALGDILADEGYDQTLIVGSDITFASRNVYFTDHGSYHLEDYNSMIADGRLPADYKVWWGYEDEKLFQFAKEDLDKIGNSDQPFNYTLLTVDTHFPDGYVCGLCRDDFGNNQYANVIACSSRQVVDFVRWVQKQSWYENTTIVICGDHPTMDGDFCDDVPSSYMRKTYTCYINADATVEDPTRVRTYSTLDDFPTTIAALGAEIEGNRLGLGTNLFSSKETLIERDGLKKVNSEFLKQSKFMQNLADIKSNDVKEFNQLRNADLEYREEKQADGTFKITVGGLGDLDKYIESLYFYVYNREGTGESLKIDASDNGDGTYTAIFEPGMGELPEDDEYRFQAYVHTSIGESALGTMRTIILK